MSTRTPSFLCIGAQKAGTTWLYSVLKRHPQIWLPPVKELHFFDTQELPWSLRVKRAFTHRGMIPRWKRLRDQPSRWLYIPYPLWWKWYLALFAPTPPGHITGDMTPSYSAASPKAVQHVAARLPQARILFLMRDPVERVWSALRQQGPAARGADLRKTIYRYLSDPHVRRRCDYARALYLWRPAFPTSQFMPGFYDDLCASPEGFLRPITDFLGVRYVPLKVMESHKNVGPKMERPEWLTYLLTAIFQDMNEWLAARLGGWPLVWAQKGRERLQRGGDFDFPAEWIEALKFATPPLP